MGGHGWGQVSRDELIKAVHVAVDHGLTFFDTADTYGLGEGERTLAEALGTRRSQAVIATKFGVRVEQGRTFYDNSPEWIRSALQGSLGRLQTDYIDIYQIHYRDNVTPLESVFETLVRLRDQGLVRYFGLSNITAKDKEELAGFHGQFVSFQNELSLAKRDNQETIVALAQELKLSPLTWGSLGQGVLTGKYGSDSNFGADDRRSRVAYSNFHGDKYARNLRIVDSLRQIAHEVDKPIPAVAIRWILDSLPTSVAIAGIKNVTQLEANLASLEWSLSDDQMALLNSVSSEKACLDE